MIDVNEVYAEIERLSKLLIEKSRAYDRREAIVTERNASGAQNYSGNLYTVLKKDLLLQDLSGASKTIAAILNAHAATLIAHRAHVPRG